MKKNMALLLGISFILIFSSCKNYYYFPTEQNVMNFKKKNDVNIAMNISSNDRFHVNLGYAFTDHMAFSSNLNTFTLPLEHKEYQPDKSPGFIWNNELIYYTKIKNEIFPALNVGFGYGNMGKNIKYFDLNMYSYYVQPSIGFVHNHFEMAISSRISKLDYNLILGKDFPADAGETLYEYYDLRDIGKTDFYFLEPAFTIGFGFENLKLRYQIIRSYKLNSGDILFREKSQFLFINLTFNLEKVQ